MKTYQRLMTLSYSSCLSCIPDYISLLASICLIINYHGAALGQGNKTNMIFLKHKFHVELELVCTNSAMKYTFIFLRNGALETQLLDIVPLWFYT